MTKRIKHRLVAVIYFTYISCLRSFECRCLLEIYSLLPFVQSPIPRTSSSSSSSCYYYSSERVFCCSRAIMSTHWSLVKLLLLSLGFRFFDMCSLIFLPSYCCVSLGVGSYFCFDSVVFIILWIHIIHIFLSIFIVAIPRNQLCASSKFPSSMHSAREAEEKETREWPVRKTIFRVVFLVL